MILFPYYRYLYVLNPQNKPFSINFFEKGKLSFTEKFLRIDVSDVDYLDLNLTDNSQSYNFLDVFIEYNDYKDINYHIFKIDFSYNVSNPSLFRPFSVEYVYNKVYYKKTVPKIETVPSDPVLNTVVYLLRDGELLCVHVDNIKAYDYILFYCNNWSTLLTQYSNNFFIRNNFCKYKYISLSLSSSMPPSNNLSFPLFYYKNVDFIRFYFSVSVSTGLWLGSIFSYGGENIVSNLFNCPANFTSSFELYPFDSLDFFIYGGKVCSFSGYYVVYFKPFLYVV